MKSVKKGAGAKDLGELVQLTLVVIALSGAVVAGLMYLQQGVAQGPQVIGAQTNAVAK